MSLSAADQYPVLLVARSIILRELDRKILFIQRSRIDRRNAGMWEFPGGKADPGETVAQATLRETAEESGLLVEILHESAYVDGERIILDGSYVGHRYEAHFSICKHTDGTIVLSDEHEDHDWFTYIDALELELAPEVELAMRYLQGILFTR